MSDGPPELPPPDVLRSLVEQATEQLRLQHRELELQDKWNEQQWDYANRALNVQAEDLKDGRAHQRKQSNSRYVFVGFLALVGVAFVLFLSYFGKDDLVREILKVAGSFLAGGLSAYWLGKARGRREAEEQAEPSAGPSR